jgi:hypothetical protein
VHHDHQSKRFGFTAHCNDKDVFGMAILVTNNDGNSAKSDSITPYPRSEESGRTWVKQVRDASLSFDASPSET